MGLLRFRNGIRLAVVAVMVLYFGIRSVVLANEQTIAFDRAPKGIQAQLHNADDFYYHADGRKIHLLRKQGVFAIDADRISVQELDSKLQNESQFSTNKLITRHGLGRLKVVQIEQPSAPDATVRKHGVKRGVSSLISTKIKLKSMDRQIQRVSQVFANADGNGDMVLLPKLTFRLSKFAPRSELQRLSTRYQFQVERRLKLSGWIYSAKMNNTALDDSELLAVVRAIAAEPHIEWAEPQFLSKPFKTSFVPNDTLIDEQWHLLDRGFRGSRCDTDCDANNAWSLTVSNGSAATRGDGMVIAILDDGVQLDHPDLAANIWQNPGEACGPPMSASENFCSDGIDNDSNGFVDDVNGFDFIVDAANNPNLQNANFDGGGTCSTGVDAQPGQDNDPSPQATSDCVTINGDPVEQDDHGTAVAGIAAAVGNNNLGVAGVAFEAQILPIRLISDFDGADIASFCVNAAEAMAYAGRHADVINNSWGMNDTCMALEDTIKDVVAGQTAGGGSTSVATVFKRPNLGSPVIFSAGNSASGWVKVTVPVSAGEHSYEWRVLRSAFPGSFSNSAEDDTVWLDEITFPNGEVEDFEVDLSRFESDIVLNSRCDDICTNFEFSPRPEWEIETDANRVFAGFQGARLDASGADCGNSYISVLREDPAGEISFWVWVSTNLEDGSDKFEFLIDGKEVISYGDIASFVDNAVSYPANLAETIAVGASWSGDLDDVQSVSQQDERRLFYSQFGPQLDILAPSSGQHLGIATTDRTSNSDGFNRGTNPNDLLDSDYTNTFGGTSASAPMVAGAAAAILSVDNTQSAAGVRNILQITADKIGPHPYSLGRNDEYGFGRLNLHKALQQADTGSFNVNNPDPLCNADLFDYSPAQDSVLAGLLPIAPFCPAQGPIPVSDELCIPVKASNGNVALICL